MALMVGHALLFFAGLLAAANPGRAETAAVAPPQESWGAFVAYGADGKGRIYTAGFASQRQAENGLTIFCQENFPDCRLLSSSRDCIGFAYVQGRYVVETGTTPKQATEHVQRAVGLAWPKGMAVRTFCGDGTGLDEEVR